MPEKRLSSYRFLGTSTSVSFLFTPTCFKVQVSIAYIPRNP